jgi:lipopolysaccharide transport system permease protein
MIDLVKLIFARRELVLELARRELFVGHGRHFLGGLWVFANPLVTLLGFFLVFKFIFPSRLPAGGAAEVFLLTGLIQWIVLSELLVRACSTLRSHANLVKQINFPIETLFAKTVASGLFIQLIMTTGLFAVMLTLGAASFQAIPLWLLAMVLQATFMLGVGLLLGALSPFVPDLAEGVGIVARMGLFLTPILYTSDLFGPVARFLFHLNPLSYFAWIHQDALFAQSITAPIAWLVAAGLAVASLAVGNAVFRALNSAFTDVL